MNRWLRVSLAALAMCSLAFTAPIASGAATSLPHAEADAVDGTHFTIPDAVHGHTAIFIVAVSRAASGHIKEWAERLSTAAGDRAAVYSVVVAEGVPFFVKGAIRKQMADDVPATARARSLLTFSGAGWKTLSVDGPDDAPTVFVASAAGDIVYAQRSAFTDAAVAATLKALP